MKFLRSLFLALCIPGILLSSIPMPLNESQTFQNNRGEEIFIPRDEDGLINPWGYFDANNMFTQQSGYINHYFDFIKLICEEEFLETLSEEELYRIVDFSSWIVKYSVPESRPDLYQEYENHIEELHQLFEEENDDCTISYSSFQMTSPYLFSVPYAPQIWLCKKKKGGFWNQVKRKAGHLGHWCNKHKKPLIAGAVVVGVVAAVALTGGVGGGAAAAVGGGLVSSMDDAPPSGHINKPGEVGFQENSPEYIPPPPQQQYFSQEEKQYTLPSLEIEPRERSPPPENGNNCPETEELYNTIAYEAEVSKEIFLEETVIEPIDDQDETFLNKAINVGKELGSKIAHGTVETASKMTKSAGILGGVAGHIIDRNHQEELQEHYYHSHIAIDNLFETDIGYLYTEQGKEEAKYIKEKFGVDVFSDSTPESVEQTITVYKSINKVTGEVDYVGITNDFSRRYGEHLRSKGINIEPIANLPQLSRSDARSVEQVLIKLHGLEKNGGTLSNRINSIAKTNPSYAESLNRGCDILRESGYEGIE